MSYLIGNWADPAAGGREENGSCSAYPPWRKEEGRPMKTKSHLRHFLAKVLFVAAWAVTLSAEALTQRPPPHVFFLFADMILSQVIQFILQLGR
jgi:hypothetical protein